MTTHTRSNPLFEGSGAEVQAMRFPYRRSVDQDRSSCAHHPVVIVGAGPVGLTLAIDMAQRGHAVVLMDREDSLSEGSRAIAFAKRTLEIWDRLGVGDRMVAKGVSWSQGKVFFKEDLVYQFNMLSEAGHERPAFINLQQYYAEAYLVERALQLPQIDLRWLHEVVGVEPGEHATTLAVRTPEGDYSVDADWVIACDGSRSPVRQALGLESKGQVFQDRFLIADVKMQAEFPVERWFWFDPPFHSNQSALLHLQPDNVWRVDFQLGWDADPEVEKRPERIIPRIQAMLGKDVDFSLEWSSVYTFACQRMDRFMHSRVIFAGDAAHRVSPFGGRGANSGIQDADNLAWKLDWVLRGKASRDLLESYCDEREYAADENILNSTRSTDFITPKTTASRLFRDAVLGLAETQPFARRLVNSGRLSVPATLHYSSLSTPDADHFDTPPLLGAPLPDAPITVGGQPTWLLRQTGPAFTLLHFGPVPEWVNHLTDVTSISIGTQILDIQDLVRQRLDGADGTTYLVRPDQHICARWRNPDEATVRAALSRASDAVSKS
ncbi:FAD-dependent oxidoreductase [Comamonas testosteroni]|uniref:FAD-dependent oxidoreductase n=1 Tax=Comamonas testosteroni TaxID=285 RepID=UPI00391904D4